MNTYLLLDYQVIEKIWGNHYFLDHNLTDNSKETGELWSCSGHSEHYSYITSGPLKGFSLDYVYKTYPSLFGTKEEEFPILVKLISSKSNLSVQVHPDDDYARKFENEAGKTEGWLILSEEKTNIILGHNAKNKEELVRNIKNKTYDSLLNKFEVKKGEFYEVYPGTIHAICSNNLILEVQQSSNVTYRLYDYDRVLNGEKRELHLEKGLDVTNYNVTQNKSKNYFLENKEHVVLWENKYFSVNLVNVTDSYEIKAESKFVIVTVLDDFILDGTLVSYAKSFIVTVSSKVTIKGSGKIVLSIPK